MKVGVIGGGQLAWMMADGAKKLGVHLHVQTPSQQDPAVAIAQSTILAPVDDAAATSELAAKCDVITFENEFVDLAGLSKLAEQGVCFRPRLEVLAPVLDKYHQRCYLRDIGLPVPQFFAVEGETSVLSLALEFPVVLKARRHGYDGQGTFIIKDTADLQSTLEAIITKSQKSQPSWLIEEFVPFERELAVIAARSVNGEVVVYPIVETQQENQVCRRVIAPAGITPELTAEIEAIAQTLLNNLQAVGIFGIELFLTQDGKVLVNEIAPRTHNSGHFSLDACYTSQFEQHLRAVCGLSLGNPALHCQAAVMVNLLGYETSKSDYHQKRSVIEQIPQAHLYWYGKAESRPGRKLGHVTVLLDEANREIAAALAHKIESIWYTN